MVRTDNPVVDAILDAMLKGKDRDLLIIGTDSGSSVMLSFTKEGIRQLETRLADVEAHAERLRKAIAIGRVGLALGVELHEYDNKGNRVA